VSPAALITGANGGIGRATCATSETVGYFVNATDRAAQPAFAGTFVTLDLRALPNAPDVEESILHSVRNVFDGRASRGCINNAALQALAHTEQTTNGAFQKTWNVNVVAPMILIRHSAAAAAAGIRGHRREH